MRLSGLRDKLYWRKAYPNAPAHCFKKIRQTKYPMRRQFQSLCGQHDLYGVGVQKCRRPPAIQRCAQCDVAEMKRRGWEESGPES
jgi:hypothetical protein